MADLLFVLIMGAGFAFFVFYGMSDDELRDRATLDDLGAAPPAIERLSINGPILTELYDANDRHGDLTDIERVDLLNPLLEEAEADFRFYPED